MTPYVRSPAVKTWLALNKRQQAYLKALFEFDQAQERLAQEAGLDGPGRAQIDATKWNGVVDSVLGWRWLRWGAGPSWQGDGPIRRLLREQGLLDTGAGVTLAALKRRGLIDVRHRRDLIAAAGGYPGLVTVVYVMLTTDGRAAIRAGLAVATATTSRRTKGAAR